jgi:4-amino-4-deoxychorismate lyase
MLIYVNGSYVEEADARISPYDHGFLYGLGVFETFRVYNGHPFLFHDHYERLVAALAFLNIEWNMDKAVVLGILQELLQKNGIKDAYIRLNVSAGNGEVGLQVTPYTKPSVIMFMKPLPLSNIIVEKEGVMLRIPRNTPEGPWRLKSHHYMNNILGKREVGADVNKEGLFFTKEGWLAEGVVSNIFFSKDNTLYTPSIETGILNGITRNFVICLAKSLGYEVEEGLYTEENLLSSTEVFVTNSIQEIVPIHKISSVLFPGKEGKITNELSHAYRQHRNTLWRVEDVVKGEGL